MIERPKNSVTRFFIPLIDVMILLFCIFLLMPYMNQRGSAETNEGKTVVEQKDRTPDEMQKEVTGLREEIDLVRREINKLRNEKINPTERLSVCVMEIDSKNGSLFYYRDGVRRSIPDRRTAQDAIDEHKRRSGLDKDPFFIILLPHELTGYPRRLQLEEYKSWFKDVPYRFESPFGPVLP